MSERAVSRAMELISQCDEVIYAGVVIREINARMQELIDLARRQGKLVEL